MPSNTGWIFPAAVVAVGGYLFAKRAAEALGAVADAAQTLPEPQGPQLPPPIVQVPPAMPGPMPTVPTMPGPMPTAKVSMPTAVLDEALLYRKSVRENARVTVLDYYEGNSVYDLVKRFVSGLLDPKSAEGLDARKYIEKVAAVRDVAGVAGVGQYLSFVDQGVYGGMGCTSCARRRRLLYR